MNTNITKSKNKNSTKLFSIRLSSESKKLANAHQEAANKKKFGRKIKITEVIEFALSLVQPEHIKLLQDRSLTNEHRKEQMRQIYIEKVGPITKEEFIGFMMTDAFVEFRKTQTCQQRSA